MATTATVHATDTIAHDRAGKSVQSYINWNAIIAGSVMTSAALLVLAPFGAAIGLSLTSARTGEGASATTLSWLAILFFAAINIYAVGMGAYVTGRLRPPVADAKPDEVAFRDGMSGVVMWGIGVIVSTMLVLWSVANVARSAGSTVAQIAGPSIAAAAQSAGSSIGPDVLTDVLLRGTAPAGAVATAPRTDSEVRAEIGRIIGSSVASGDMTADDKRYVAGLISQRTGISEADAAARLDANIARAKQARDSAANTARETAEAARKSTASAAFWMTILALLTGAVAWYSAQLGGRHRDENRYTARFGRA